MDSHAILYDCISLTHLPLVLHIQYIPRNMHTVFALLCFVVVIHWLIFPYPSGLLHWHCGNLTIAPVPAKQPWWIWINTSCEFIMNDCITTTKQSTTKPCAYFLGYTVYVSVNWIIIGSDNGLLSVWRQAITWTNVEYLSINTLRPRQNGRRFPDDTFKCIFLNENARISIKISMKFVPKGPINNIPALVQIMAWRRPGDKPLSEPMMVSLLTHICVTRPQWVRPWGTIFNEIRIKIQTFH